VARPSIKMDFKKTGQVLSQKTKGGQGWGEKEGERIDRWISSFLVPQAISMTGTSGVLTIAGREGGKVHRRRGNNRKGKKKPKRVVQPA